MSSRGLHFLLISLLLGQCVICSTQEDDESVTTAEYNGHQAETDRPNNNSTCEQLSTPLVTAEYLDQNETECEDIKHKGLPYERCGDHCTMAIGSNDCIAESKCNKNANLFLLIAFAFAGLLLVFFIRTFDITISQGAVHGLIFYANVIWVYESLYLDNYDVKYCFLKAFLAWMNLDFGIKFCLYKDLTLYWKTWLQFVFPLYICVIAGLIIILSRYLQCIVRIFGRSPVQVLAVLFLLSHAKLLRTIATAVQPSRNKNGTLVWGYDSDMEFNHKMCYPILFAVAIVVFCVVWLPFTLALLFIQPLRSCKLINKLKPFFDAYTGPFQPKSHFWVGLLCLVRGILLFVYVLTQFFNKAQLNSIALVITVTILLVVLYSSGGLYREPTTFAICNRNFEISFLSMLEISFLLNLAALGFATICIDYISCSNPQAKAYAFLTSVIIVFLQFAGIIVWHVCKKVSLCYQRRRRQNYDNLEANNETEAARPSTTANIVIGNGTFLRSNAHIRESILTDESQNNK